MAVVQMTKEDNALQEKLKIDDFLTSPGFKLFMAEFDSQRNYAAAQLKIAKGGYIDPTKLCKYNYDLGYDAGLDAVSRILTNMRDELAGPSVSAKK